MVASENDSSNSRMENMDNSENVKPTPLKFTTEVGVSFRNNFIFYRLFSMMTKKSPK